MKYSHMYDLYVVAVSCYFIFHKQALFRQKGRAMARKNTEAPHQNIACMCGVWAMTVIQISTTTQSSSLLGYRNNSKIATYKCSTFYGTALEGR